MNRIIILVDSGICGDDLTWELDTEGTLTVSGTGDMWDYTSSNVPWYSNRDSIKKVAIEKGVTAIGAGAFDDCGIENLTISVPTIGLTFAGMSTLKTVIIGNDLSLVAANAFSGLHDTAVIYVPNQTIKTLVIDSGFPADRILWDIVDSGTCGDDLTWELDSVGTLTISGAGDMWDFGYYTPWSYHVFSITEVIIDNGVTSIGGNAFSYCALLTSVTIPDSVTPIGDWAFMDCTSLTDVLIPDSVTVIGIEAFDNCTSLTIHCYEDSYAHEYAIDNELPLIILFKAETKTIETSPLPNAQNIIVKHITVTNTVDAFYNLAVDFEKAGEVFFILAVYEGDLLAKTHLADGNAEIKGIPESDLAKGKIFIWDKNMQPCIEVISK